MDATFYNFFIENEHLHRITIHNVSRFSEYPIASHVVIRKINKQRINQNEKKIFPGMTTISG